MEDFVRSAECLVETIPFVRQCRGRLIVVKLGGSAMEEKAAVDTVLKSVVFLESVGVRTVLVHGGGKPIDRAMAASGLTPKKILGRRYTDDATLRIVVDVLTNEINTGIVRRIRELGGRAVGMHTAGLQSLFGHRITAANPDGGSPVDLGAVGEVNRVDVGLIEDCTRSGVVPVIPSLAYDANGAWLNVNADTAACGAAGALKAFRLVMMTDTPGILRDPKDPTSVIDRLTYDECEALKKSGVIDGGMIPKVEACYEAIRAGVDRVQVIDGRRPYSLLAEVFHRTIGTDIIR